MSELDHAAARQPTRSSWRTRILFFLVVALGASDVLLALALASRVGDAAPQVRIVPGLDKEMALSPDTPSPELLRSVAALYVQTQQTYTPNTIERVHEALLKRVSPEQYHKARAYFAGRAKEVVSGRISASLVLDDPAQAPVEPVGSGSWRVRLSGLQRLYMDSDLVSERRFAFGVVLAAEPPSLDNSHALYVSGMSAATIEQEAGR